MIQRYVYGNPFPTEAVTEPVELSAGNPPVGSVDTERGFRFVYRMDDMDIIYGLGEANRGLNKRGFRYVSDCADDPDHTEDKASLYGAHNFIVISGKTHIGLFFDYPTRIAFDIGYTRTDTLEVSCAHADLNLYVVTGTGAYDVVRQFRRIIGRSYIPPKFAFGFGQSRWGYAAEEDFWETLRGYRENHIPLDMLYMDIDYMQDFKDFTVDAERFSDFPAFVRKMKEHKIHLIPIIDAGVKVEEGYPVYEEGKENGYFCKREDGSDFVAAVWPGDTHFPDVLNPEARKWFGDWYRVLIDQGIEGFWNDMNEPAIFYSPEGLTEGKEKLARFAKEGTCTPQRIWAAKDAVQDLANSEKDYDAFYHRVDGKNIRHSQVHNLYGYYMTRAAAEAFERIDPDRRFLLFSRASYIGMHRCGGIWTGDNKSWWSHLLLNLKMLPSLNMCGFLYVGADLGGFGANVTRDLLLRWLALGVFTPLMRDHSAIGTRKQECFRFERPEDFAHVVGVRYRLLPYLYSEYMKAALGDDLYFRPLAFEWPEDGMAAQVEDQLLLGNECMIAPVYVQNARGRYVYLPEEMKLIKFLPDGSVSEEVLAKGHHYVQVELNEVPLFIRKGACIPLAKPAENVEELDAENLSLIGYDGAEYVLYDDDGLGKSYSDPEHFRRLKKLS